MQFKLSVNEKLRILSVYVDGWKAQKEKHHRIPSGARESIHVLIIH